MIISQDPVTGAIAYLFNDTTLIACVKDIDCPGSAVCTVNPTSWKSALPSGMCSSCFAAAGSASNLMELRR